MREVRKIFDIIANEYFNLGLKNFSNEDVDLDLLELLKSKRQKPFKKERFFRLKNALTLIALHQERNLWQDYMSN